jgi:hypothetical protein
MLSIDSRSFEYADGARYEPIMNERFRDKNTDIMSVLEQQSWEFPQPTISSSDTSMYRWYMKVMKHGGILSVYEHHEVQIPPNHNIRLLVLST